MFSRATRGAVQALRVAAVALFKLQWSLMVLGGPKVFSSAPSCAKRSLMRVLSALSVVFQVSAQ